jgi:hypothetical protein
MESTMFSSSKISSLGVGLLVGVFSCGPISYEVPGATPSDGGQTLPAFIDAGVVEAPPNLNDYLSACNAVVREYCKLQVRCGALAPNTNCSGMDDQCASVNAKVVAGQYAYKMDVATSCFGILKNATCKFNFYLDAKVCNAVTEGTGGLNAACSHTSTCKSDYYCDDSATCPGRCAPRIPEGQTAVGYGNCAVGSYEYNGICQRPIAMGGSCAPVAPSSSTQECAGEASCSPTTRTCVARTAFVVPVENEPCANGGCGLGLYCKNGTCLKPSASGANCDSVTKCQAGTFCSQANVCLPEVSTGGTCRSSAECARDSMCLITSGSATGTCAPRSAKIGQSCVGEASPSCSEGYCTATAANQIGVCAAIKSVGASCRALDECGSFAYCSASGICSAKKSAGANCMYRGECVDSAYCSVGGTCINKFSPGASCTSSGQCLGYCDSDKRTCSGC